jgi:hypothetical protein
MMPWAGFGEQFDRRLEVLPSVGFSLGDQGYHAAVEKNGRRFRHLVDDNFPVAENGCAHGSSR